MVNGENMCKSATYQASIASLNSFIRFKGTGKRDEVFLATKFGVVRDTKSGVDGSAQNVEKSFNQSIQRLGVPHVDLYYLHRSVHLIRVCSSRYIMQY